MASAESQSVEILKEINEKMDILMRFFLDKNDIPIVASSSIPVQPLRAQMITKNAECDITVFAPTIIKGKPYIRNCRGDLLTEDYDWVGRYNPDTKKIDTTIAKPRNLNLGGGRRKTRSKRRN